MKILVTGSAGFIGYFLTRELIQRNHEVVGIDNLNSYYDVRLKYARLAQCGVDEASVLWKEETKSNKYENYRFIRMDLDDKAGLMNLCKREKFDVVVNLAAQAGVRYSISNPDAYIQSNVTGFLNILEACRNFSVNHLVYASSSSVYGLNEKKPYSVTDNANHPVSLYAATKKSNELMAHAYSHLYKIPTTGLRFFTVYGPWGRPDMSYYLFAEAIMENRPIKFFNYGLMKRDFTYVSDIVDGIVRVINTPPAPSEKWNALQPHPGISSAPYSIYNIGNNNPVSLLDFIREIEKLSGLTARIELMEMQPGDVQETWADVDDLMEKFNYKPVTPIQTGLAHFMEWFMDYYEQINRQPAVKIKNPDFVNNVF
jgi:UDP-glucuronate 4-epimerase